MRLVFALCLCLATATSAAAQTATAAVPPNPAVVDRAQEYRMWSAEQMVNRLTEKFARANKVCDQGEDWPLKLSEKCRTSVLGAYPILATIREVAASGDAVQWAELIDRIHKFEREIEGPLNNLRREH